jgi:hypothetical protein
MKKLFIAALFVVAAGTSAFAFDATKVSYRVKNSFETLFNNAQNVEWATKENFIKASFILDDQKVEAFFDNNGELIGESRKIEFKKLPANAVRKIKKDFASYTVTESIQFDQNGERSYYVSLSDGAKQHILQVSLLGSIDIYK